MNVFRAPSSLDRRPVRSQGNALALTAMALLLAGCGGGGGTSSSITPSLVVQPASVSSVVGSPVSFYVTARGSGFTYQWYKLVNGTYAYVSNATSSVLTLPSVQTTSAGSYRVVVSYGKVDTTSADATLTVVDAPVAPTIATQPTSTTVLTNNEVLLSVAANGTNLTYQWSKDGVEISGATRPYYYVSKASANNAGSYTVKVTNAVSTVTSDPATLTVN